MRKRKSVIIELTSLLDVIFIILFMVMNQSQTAAEEAKNNAETQIAAAKTEVSQMAKERDSYIAILDETEKERENLALMENRIESLESFSEYAHIVSVYVLDGGYKRSIKITDENEIASIDFSNENIDIGKNVLISELKNYIEGSENPVFITFSYNSDKIYRKDYNMISEAITAVHAEYDDVYIKLTDEKTMRKD